MVALASRMTSWNNKEEAMWKELFFSICERTATDDVTVPKLKKLGNCSFSFLQTGNLSLSLPDVETATASGTGEGAFFRSSALWKVYLPKLDALTRCMFEYCTNLEEAYFDSATTIGDTPFARARNLRKVYIPNVDNALSSRVWGYIEGLPSGGLDIYNTNFSCNRILTRSNFLSMGNTAVSLWPNIRFHGSDGQVSYNPNSGSWEQVDG